MHPHVPHTYGMLHQQRQSNREQEATVPLFAKLILASGQQRNVEQHSSENRPGACAFEAVVHWLGASLTTPTRGQTLNASPAGCYQCCLWVSEWCLSS